MASDFMTLNDTEHCNYFTLFNFFLRTDRTLHDRITYGCNDPAVGIAAVGHL